MYEEAEFLRQHAQGLLETKSIKPISASSRVIACVPVLRFDEFLFATIGEFNFVERDAAFLCAVACDGWGVLGEIVRRADRPLIRDWQHFRFAPWSDAWPHLSHALRGDLSRQYVLWQGSGHSPDEKHNYWILDDDGRVVAQPYEHVRKVFLNGIPFGGVLSPPALALQRERHGNLSR